MLNVRKQKEAAVHFITKVVIRFLSSRDSFYETYSRKLGRRASISSRGRSLTRRHSWRSPVELNSLWRTSQPQLRTDLHGNETSRYNGSFSLRMKYWICRLLTTSPFFRFSSVVFGSWRSRGEISCLLTRSMRCNQHSFRFPQEQYETNTILFLASCFFFLTSLTLSPLACYHFSRGRRCEHLSTGPEFSAESSSCRR